MELNKEISLFELQVDHESTIYLREAAKWAKFLSILGFVWCGLLLLAGFSILVTKSAYAPSYTTWICLLYMALAVVYFFPCIYMLNFARKTKTALQNNDQEYLNNALKNLRSTFRYLGIMAIIGLALMVILVVFNLFNDLGRL